MVSSLFQSMSQSNSGQYETLSSTPPALLPGTLQRLSNALPSGRQVPSMPCWSGCRLLRVHGLFTEEPVSAQTGSAEGGQVMVTSVSFTLQWRCFASQNRPVSPSVPFRFLQCRKNEDRTGCADSSLGVSLLCPSALPPAGIPLACPESHMPLSHLFPAS